MVLLGVVLGGHTLEEGVFEDRFERERLLAAAHKIAPKARAL